MEESANIHQTVNHLFREESGKMVAVLVNVFGVEHMDLAEDVVQDALVKALETWKFNGLPDHPRAWLYRTAKNRAIDIIRKRKHQLQFDFSDPQRQLLTSEYTLTSTMNDYWQADHIRDDFLAMMYASCHPDIAPDHQITFILKCLCGFSTREVAKAFLSTEDTISKRLHRTKTYFRERKIRPQIPSPEHMVSRTSAVLRSIYLLFNEGYNSSHADQLIRKDLIAQAMRLCTSLLEHPKTQLPEAYALMALMCFHAARTDGRTTADGALILLAEQDRRTWDQTLIESGNAYLNQAAFGNSITSYHLEAAIAYQHCVAKDYDSTDWPAILEYYDALLALSHDPVVALNRCLVVSQIHGPQEALLEMAVLEGDKRMERYYLYHTVLASLHERLGQGEKASHLYTKAITQTQSGAERQLLQNRIDRLNALRN